MLAAGAPCVLVDEQGRSFLLDLQPGGSFSTHQGQIPHDDIIGAPDGSRLVTNKGATYVALRPTLEEFVLTMKRGAQIVYPKDWGAIITHGDIAPGHTVVEAGTGSGALTLALLRAVGPEGRVVSVDLREDHQRRAARTISRFHGGGTPATLDLRLGDVADVVGEVRPDRLVLDVPEPWHPLSVAVEAMEPGAAAVAYVPTVPQVAQTVEAMGDRWGNVVAREVLVREWHVSGRSVRPEHTMVGHTGFVVSGRLLAPA
jgi:tRNA (adenine57-N1/adenine58-N1)-methyltransferase